MKRLGVRCPACERKAIAYTYDGRIYCVFCKNDLTD